MAKRPDALKPVPTGPLLRDGLALHQAGRTAEAEIRYRQVLAQRPDDPDGLHLLGVLLLQIGRPGEAVNWLEQAVRQRPRKADFQSHLGMAYRAIDRLDDAIRAYGRAIKADPTYGEAVYNLANACRDAGRVAEAEDAYRRALAINPEHVDAHINLGSLLWQAGRAAEAAASFETAVGLDPDNADAHNNLGGVLKDRNLFDEAVACFERALAIRPDFPDALHNLGNVRRNQGRLDEARAAYGRALAIRPDDLIARWSGLLSLPNLYESEQQIDELRARWSAGLDELADGLRLDTPARVAEAKRALLSQTNFNLHYQGRIDRDLQARYGALLHRIAASAYPRWADGQERRPPIGRRPRVGFVSAFFCRHTVCHLFAPMLLGLDRDALEVHAFHAGFADDDETKRLKDGLEHFHQGFRNADALVADLIARRLDAIVYTDIGMAPVVQLPAALRLAPLQAVLFGHPVTTGLPTMDRFLTAASWEGPDGDSHYTEPLYRLANLGVCYALPEDARRGDESIESGDGPLYVCTQSLFKLLPVFDTLIAGIAKDVGRCRFDFIAHGAADVTTAFQKRLGRAFAAVGLEATDFCRFHPFLSRADYFALNRRADVILDSVPWSGGKTTLDAVACGKAVVTLPGVTMRSRTTAGILERAGVTDTIAATPDDYIAIAARLGRDRTWRREIEERIRAGHGNVFDDRAPVGDLQGLLVGRGVS